MGRLVTMRPHLLLGLLLLTTATATFLPDAAADDTCVHPTASTYVCSADTWTIPGCWIYAHVTGPIIKFCVRDLP